MRNKFLKIVYVVLYIFRASYIIVAWCAGLIAFFAFVGSLLFTIHPVEIPAELRLYTNFGYAMLMTLSTLINIVFIAGLTHIMRSIKDDLK